jgi:hypothetical protein
LIVDGWRKSGLFSLTRVQLNRVRKILTDRYAGFHVETRANIQALQEPPVETGTIVAETVAGVNVGHESPVSVQTSDAKLIAE